MASSRAADKRSDAGLERVDGGSDELQVINVREGKIIHIQDGRSRRQARVLSGMR